MTTEPYKTTFKNLTELQAAVGQEVGLSPWYTMDQSRINTFADVTEDQQWIHVDAERSQKESPYKTTIAHGFLVLSMASKMAYDSFEISSVTMAVNYGLNKVRFINATPADAKIRGRFVLADYKEVKGGARYILNLTIEIEGEERPALVAEWIGQAYEPTETATTQVAEKKKS